jgi:hypothetical protein
MVLEKSNEQAEADAEKVLFSSQKHRLKSVPGVWTFLD